MKESLSALLDGECSPSEIDSLLVELERDPALRREFTRMVLGREARSGTRIRKAQVDFSAGVLAALQDEPGQEGSRVVPFRPRLGRLPWKTLTGLAAAAAVGAVAVLVVRPESSPSQPSLAVQPASLATTQVGEAAPVETQYSELDDENARQLRNYLMTYSQSRGQQGMGSTLGYARYTAYTGDPPAPKKP
jgi:sigma-E factor negative regulatory protein RseA